MNSPHASFAKDTDHGIEWHTSTDGNQGGPFTREEIHDLIERRALSRNTLVWNRNLPDWLPILSSEFVTVFSTPPPLTVSTTNQKHTDKKSSGNSNKILSLIGSGSLLLIAVFLSRSCGGMIGQKAAENHLADRNRNSIPSNRPPGPDPFDLSVESMLPQIVAEMNERLPITVDRETRLDRLSAGPGEKVTYHYSLINLRISQIDKGSFIPQLREQLVNGYRNEKGMSYFRDNDVSMDFKYTDPDGAYFTTISVGPSDLR